MQTSSGGHILSALTEFHIRRYKHLITVKYLVSLNKLDVIFSFKLFSYTRLIRFEFQRYLASLSTICDTNTMMLFKLLFCFTNYFILLIYNSIKPKIFFEENAL